MLNIQSNFLNKGMKTAQEQHKDFKAMIITPEQLEQQFNNLKQ
jgi:hypothetical protein